MASTTQTQALNDLAMKSDEAAIAAKQLRAAVMAAQNPSDREYAERQAYNADQRAAAARYAYLGAKADARALEAA